MSETIKLNVLISLFATLDVGTLFALSLWIGIPATLIVVLVSTLLGLISCRNLWHRFVRRCEEQVQEHGSPLPEQVKHYLGAESALILLSMGLFIFPGLLSDVTAYLVLIPIVRNKIKEFVSAVQRRQRERRSACSAKHGG